MVPAGNTEVNDPYLANVTVIETARREPGWPHVQQTPSTVNVVLNRNLPDAKYVVHVDVDSCTGVDACGPVVQSKLNNGFKLLYPGNAADIKVKMLVEHPSI